MKNLTIRLLGIYLDTLAVVSPSSAAKKGFQLFCRPYRIPANERQHAFFNTAEKFNLNHEGNLVQGYRWGNGPKKILFLHGWQSHTYRWKTYVEALPKSEYTIYSLDAPGHGLSSGNFLSVPLYSSLIESFVQQNSSIHTVVAHSLGGFSLLYTLFREPGLPIDRVVLLAPPGEAGEFIAAFQQKLRVSDKVVKLVVDHFTKQFDVSPDFFSARRFVEKINVDGLIIHDEDDTEAPYEHVVPLQQVWKRSQLITTKGFGHNLKSTMVVKEVVDYIAKPARQHAAH